MSSSSLGIAVSVSKSSKSRSPSPPSRARTCPPVARSSVDDACERATLLVLKDSGRVPAPPAQESDLDFVFSPAMKGFRRQMLPVSAGGDVCRVLKRSRDGWMRPPVGRPHQLAHFCNAQVYDRMPPVQHLCELLLHCRMPRTRPESPAAVVKISAGLDCASVSPLSSVVICPPETACTHTPVASAVLQVSPCSSWRPRNDPHKRH